MSYFENVAECEVFDTAVGKRAGTEADIGFEEPDAKRKREDSPGGLEGDGLVDEENGIRRATTNTQ